jgi:integrase/recombinase XerD
MCEQLYDDPVAAGQQSAAPPLSTAKLLEDFAAAMRQERGLAISTISRTCHAIAQFLLWCGQKDLPLAELRIDSVDEFLASKGQQGCVRISIRSQAQWLRGFLRHAERRGWCKRGIADAILSPRIYQQEGLPAGPTWEQTQALIASVSGQRASAVRDRAILMLLAVYGLRSGDVSRLRLEDLDWEREILIVAHPKQRRARQYPLIHSVGEAIVAYFREVRPRCQRREVFLTLKQPFRPLSQGALWNVVGVRLKKLGATARHLGPHSLRHACATHLLAENFSLKEIADQLGHGSLNVTRTYAKVDVTGLRTVADFDLGGLR